MSEMYAGPVFGAGVAFEDTSPERLGIVRDQMQEVADLFQVACGPVLAAALPDKDTAYATSILAEVTPKSIAFAPALTHGELPDTSGIAGAAKGVFGMYVTDQLIDRSDLATHMAVEFFTGDWLGIRSEMAASVAARLHILRFMRESVMDIYPADGNAVLDCFSEKVLRTEAQLQRLSQEYLRTDASERKVFLSRHGSRLAIGMSSDAGVQSVTASLYAAYRREDPYLPAVAEIHADPDIVKQLEVYNTTARVADEYGDWWMDAGGDTDKGTFSINPFNQYDETLVATLCTLAGFDGDTEGVHRGFKEFHKMGGSLRQELGELVTGQFFDRLRQADRALPPETRRRYDVYCKLLRRVGEISFVNMQGDIALSKPA